MEKKNDSVQKIGPDGGVAGKIKDKMNQVTDFFREVKIELQKVTFPTRQETMGHTLVVLVLTIIIAVYLGLSDWALAYVVSMLLQVG
ncbi:MAG: preprotein translocase subunit SecE [Thermodesulfobacteriota bacterium]